MKCGDPACRVCGEPLPPRLLEKHIQAALRFDNLRRESEHRRAIADALCVMAWLISLLVVYLFTPS